MKTTSTDVATVFVVPVAGGPIFNLSRLIGVQVLLQEDSSVGWRVQICLCLGQILVLATAKEGTTHVDALVMRRLLHIVEKLRCMLLRHRHALVLVEAARRANIVKWVHS